MELKIESTLDQQQFSPPYAVEISPLLDVGKNSRENLLNVVCPQMLFQQLFLITPIHIIKDIVFTLAAIIFDC